MATMTSLQKAQLARHVELPATTLEPLLGDNHPLNDIMGTRGGPDWDAMLENIKRNRKEIDRLVLGDDAED